MQTPTTADDIRTIERTIDIIRENTGLSSLVIRERLQEMAENKQEPLSARTIMQNFHNDSFRAGDLLMQQCLEEIEKELSELNTSFLVKKREIEQGLLSENGDILLTDETEKIAAMYFLSQKLLEETEEINQLLGIPK